MNAWSSSGIPLSTIIADALFEQFRASARGRYEPYAGIPGLRGATLAEIARESAAATTQAARPGERKSGVTVALVWILPRWMPWRCRRDPLDGPERRKISARPLVGLHGLSSSRRRRGQGRQDPPAGIPAGPWQPAAGV